MKTSSTALILLTFIASCTREQKQKPDPEVKSNEVKGWSILNIVNLKRECINQYGKDHPEAIEQKKENYCGCLAEKIILSIPLEKHKSPDDETIMQLQEFSKTCEDLTR